MIEQILDTVLGKLIADEVVASVPGLTGFILKFALSLLCPWQRPRLSEEWASHLAETHGTFHKAYEAIGFCFAARSMAKASRVKISELISRAQEDFGPALANWLSQEDFKEMLGPHANEDTRKQFFSEAKRQGPLSEDLMKYIDKNWRNLDIDGDPRAAADRIIIQLAELVLNQRASSKENF